MQKNTEWNTEIKISLIIIDEEERQKGRGFTKQVKTGNCQHAKITRS